jgi:hypothetical protein
MLPKKLIPMKGDFSRLSGIRATKKHFNGVLKQQGRVQLDSDWNELIAIIEHQRKTRTTDIVGSCGAPVHNSGFEIGYPEVGFNDLLIASGRMYVGGVLCETTPSSWQPIRDFEGDSTLLVDDIRVDGIPIPKNLWAQVSTQEHPIGVIAQIILIEEGKLLLNKDLTGLMTDTHPRWRPLLRYSRQPDFPTAPPYEPKAGRTDLVYLDVWERHITAVEDPALLEVALGGPDTDNRSKVIAQVKILPNVGNVDCPDTIKKWEQWIKRPNGRLTTIAKQPATPDDPCALNESGGYQGLENRLYRVEIHEGNFPSGEATFKWSRHNAANAYSIVKFIEETGGEVKKIILQQNGKDDSSSIKALDWIEISGEKTDLAVLKPGKIVQVEKVEGNTIALKADVSAYKNEFRPKARRWNISQELKEVPEKIIPGQEFILEDGIAIQFSGEEFRTGDYWVFTARTLTGTIEKLNEAKPMGIQHHYCKLALVTGLQNGMVTIEDCRPEFPPLTELPSGGGSCCTAVVKKGESIQQAIESLPEREGTVCIQAGVHFIQHPIYIVQSKGLTIKGCGGPVHIINIAEEGADGSIFHIKDSWNVNIQQLWCATLNGAQAVEAINCSFSSITDCQLICGGYTPGEEYMANRASVISCYGLVNDITISRNLILGMNGIAFQEEAGQEGNLYNNIKINNNQLFVLESAVVQHPNVANTRLDLSDNLMQGFEIKLLEKAAFPEALFIAVAEKALYDDAILSEAKAVREEGIPFEAINKGYMMPIHELNDHLNGQSVVSEETAFDSRFTATPTTRALVYLKGKLLGSKIANNVLRGLMGIVLGHDALEEPNAVAPDSILTDLKIYDNIISSKILGIRLYNWLAYHPEVKDIVHGEIIIRHNTIVGGKQNGIELETNGALTGLIIEGNQISEMGLNGIAVSHSSVDISNLVIKDNVITNCHQLAGIEAASWQYAGIVLARVRKTQIIGNIISKNGQNLQGSRAVIKGIYIHQAHETIIANNQFDKNGTGEEHNRDGVIQVSRENSNVISTDIQIINNIVKSSISKVLIINGPTVEENTMNEKAVISGNLFESTLYGPIVDLHISRCIFSNNYVKHETPASTSGDAVDFHNSSKIIAIGNICTGNITNGTGIKVFDHNI